MKALLDHKAAVESDTALVAGRGKTCRILNQDIYRALGIEHGKYRRPAGRPVVMRRLLPLDCVIEHPGLNWLPVEHEKVHFLTALGLPPSLIPQRIHYGAFPGRQRYFALKLPLALDPDVATVAYIDPGYTTNCELYFWGASHVRL